jgi:SulP family sulfate permease
MSIGNIISALLGGFGGCGLIPQTVLNVKSGGEGHFSSISYAVAMTSFVLVFAPFVGQISQAALSGIMIGVAFDTVAWESSLRTIISAINPEYHRDKSKAIISRAQRLIDFLALSISTVLCYSGNLAVGIIAGVIIQRGLLSARRRLGLELKCNL